MNEAVSRDGSESNGGGAESQGDQTDDILNQIEAVFAFGHGETIDKCATIYELLREADASDRPRLLQKAATYMDGTIESSKELVVPVYVNRSEQKKLDNKYSNVIDEMFEVLLEENKDELEFYSDFWDLTLNPIFRSDEARYFAFYWVMIDRRIPYFQITPGFRMSEESWQATGKRIRTTQNRIRFLLARTHAQRSEEASLVLREIDSCEAPEDRIRALAYVISSLRTEGELAAEKWKRILREKGML